MQRDDYITIVSGLPRSGTSMMMMMLVAGGFEPVIDNIRAADADNPKGYFEFERVKKIKEDKAWLSDAKGKAVKMISQLLLDLPPEHRYKIIFMRRKMEEILASQKQMMVRRGTVKEGGPSDAEMGAMLQQHVDGVLAKVGAMPNADMMTIDYNEMIVDAGPSIRQINRFLGGDLNVEAMAGAVDQSLYRQRK